MIFSCYTRVLYLFLFIIEVRGPPRYQYEMIVEKRPSVCVIHVHLSFISVQFSHFPLMNQSHQQCKSAPTCINSVLYFNLLLLHSANHKYLFYIVNPGRLKK